MKNKKNCQVFVSRAVEAWGSPIFYNTKHTLYYDTSFSYPWCQKYNTHSLKNDKRIPFWPLTAFLQNSDEKKVYSKCVQNTIESAIPCGMEPSYNGIPNTYVGSLNCC